MDVSRNRRVFRVLLATAIGCSLTGAVGKAQSTYTYTVIADVTDCSGIGAPVLNNSGQVAFGGGCGSASVVQRGDGGSLTSIHSWTSQTPGYVPDYNPVSINDGGTVAFRARDSQSARQVILVGSGNGVTPVVDTGIHTQYKEILWPSINTSGAVAFMADTDGSQGYDSVAVVSNGNFVTIAAPGTSSSLGPLVWAAYPGRMNSSGVVTFLGQLETTFGVFTGSGGPLSAIASGGSESIVNGINTSGRVSFVGISGNQYAVQTSDGAAPTTIATNADGYFYLTGGTSINDLDKVAFWAELNSGQTGIFTGPNPDTDGVIKSGDLLPGLGTVTAVWGITPEALNNAGQLAFGITYDLGDGTLKRAILRADPPNNPPTASDGSASVSAGGSVSGTLSATDPDGDALTYAIVTNGTKGTAQITDAATGAATYTADAGASGNDTFTFQVTDARGLASNVATVTVAIQPPACAVDVSSSIQQVKGKGATKNTSTTHRFSLRNNSSAIAGPISLALDSLTSGVTLVNAAGATGCAAPAGSPYINVNVGPDSIWSSGEIVQIELTFSVAVTPPKKSGITYTTRVLAGAGGR